MHVGLIMDEDRLMHEHGALNRLSVGLIDEGAKLTRFVPGHVAMEDHEESEQRVALAQRVEVPMRVPPWLRRTRARQATAAIEKSVPDVLYACGRDGWQVGCDLAGHLERPLALDIWCAEQLQQLPGRRQAQCVAAYIAPTQPLVDALRERVPTHLVSLVRTGVAVPAEPRPVLQDPGNLISVAIIGTGRDVQAYVSLLRALSRLVHEMPQIQAAIELRGGRSHEIWREARRLGLLGHLSPMADAAPLRTLLTQCDVLLMPEGYGQVRSLTLDAMATGMAVIASKDDHLDMLVDGRTATVVADPHSEEWYPPLRRLLGSVETARALGRSAREYVLQHHRSSRQVLDLLETLERIVSGGTYSFADAAE